ncbi:hypothetical protein OP10G_4149 [Fimbriimonas ginsengisoli Gsoil 348]|uniref:Peptidase M14 domain-containing protein n=1 Tax=Fimbriimonas ginsengisoli Gsoil 348 TaxID=661478 RepID=A0A068NVY2_FIMGI|nr:hypothetical protein OP10G_4149 [Fimbriimonas ginsengisoli Gsoil 348]
MAYGQKIREYTTEPFFLTPLIDHLPVSKTVPTPEKFFGHVTGAPNILTYSKPLADYLRALEKASPRVHVISMGPSEEGREMVVALISDADNLSHLSDIKRMNGRLADPRGLQEAEAQALLKRTVPMYWLTGAMHAPESGPPEMLMELAYRLAVSEEPNIKTIRKNSIVMITPVLDTDGRDRAVDVYRYRKANPGKAPIPLVYWGKYVAHDDNRDGMTLALKMSKALTKTWLEYHPQVMHDLHESVPFLYISTGTGPYNAWIDPITVSEWQDLAYEEIEQLTKANVPGVWTHGFFDGWAANYGKTVADGHNAIGRFYETFSAGGADTGIRSTGSASTREWYRPNPPFPSVRWSLRDNVNLSESGILVALHKVASEKDRYLQNFYLKSKRAVAKGRTEGPGAWVFPSNDPARKRQAMLLKLLQSHGIEIQRLDEAANLDGQSIPRGSYVVRMDQPYSRMADMLLDTQYYKPSDPRSYDDTGWSLGPLFDVKTWRIKDPAILDRQMSPSPDITMIESDAPRLTKPLRIALVHTWTNTQDEGWARLALEGMKVPYDYLSVHAIRDNADLRAKYDLILIPQTGGSAQSLVNGIPKVGDPIPWRPTPEYPNLGGPDATDDIRGGLELAGVANLQKFAREGGTLVCVGNAARMPIDYGLVSGVSITPPQALNAPGGVYLTTKEDAESPLLKGYGANLAGYFNMNTMPILSTGGGSGQGRGGAPERASGRGSLTDPDVIQGRPPYTPKAKPGDVPENDSPRNQGDRPRVLLRFAGRDQVMVSGMIDHPEELAGKPALIDCPTGKGHIVLFAINPFWRGQTVGSYQLVLNAAEWVKP